MSEHGAYGAPELVEALAREHFPGEGFEWEMQRRSIAEFNLVSGALANTLVFMDHPQTVRKAVPFLLLESMAWDPRYYAALYVPRDFASKGDWVPTQNLLFHRLLRGVRGHRVVARSPLPDVQLRAFRDGDAVFVVLNNLATAPATVALDMPPAHALTVRRVGRGADFRPYYREGPLEGPRGLTLAGREAAVVVAEMPGLPVVGAVNEVPFYGDRVAVKVDGEAAFIVRVPELHGLVYAEVRVGLCLGGGGRAVAISLNGRPLPVPQERAAERTDNDGEYATCRIARVGPDAVRSTNAVVVALPEGGEGAVGSVVIRAAYSTPGAGGGSAAMRAADTPCCPC